MARKIDDAQVRHVAKLGRIELTDAEVSLLGEQLSGILEAIEKLSELDTDGVEPMVHAVEQFNVFGDDEPAESLPTEAALANAPARDGDFFKAPNVTGDSQ